MTREILFRGKLRKDGRWCYGNLVVKKDGVAIITPDNTLIGVYGQVDPATVGQFTGLYDSTKWESLSKSEQQEWLKNHTANEWKGKPIFEGDIVHAVENKRYIDKFGVVEWQQCECRYLVNTGGDWLTMDDYDWKVIGNIHDNPELLEAVTK